MAVNLSNDLSHALITQIVNVFSLWNVLLDQAMTLAAVDRLVHHATIFEMNVESYRRRAAKQAKGYGRPPQRAASVNTQPY
jgi:DNA replication protein DnaC